MEDKRIYSFNKLAYLIMLGEEIELYKEVKNGDKVLYYGVANRDISDLINMYYEDAKLHQFLTAFSVLRNKFKQL